jgi:glycosyltransferase involved in cell wall biosynthesis
VLNPGAFGGLESVVESLARGHSERGHQVRVVALIEPDPRPHPFETTMERAGIEVLAVRTTSRAYLRERRAVAELLRRYRPDVVHSHGYRADVQTGQGARRAGIHTVSTAHGFLRGDWKNRFYEWLEEREWRRTDAVVAVSRPLEARLLEVGVRRDRLQFVPNAWRERGELVDRDEARRELGLPSNTLVAGWVGRMSPEKGADVLLEALMVMGESLLHLCFVGEGPQLDALRLRVKELGVGSRVHFSGVHQGAGRLFRAFDVFALSSRSEGTPIALFEAMAAGIPVVATTAGGVPDVVGEGEALMVPPEDPGAFGEALKRALSDPAAAAERARSARQRLSDVYSLEPWLSRYEDIYRAILETGL